MARRSRGIDITGLATQVAGIVVMLAVLGFISSQFRQILASLGYIALGLLVIAVVGFFVCRVMNGPPRARDIGRDERSELLSVGLAEEPDAVPTLLELVANLRSIDWFQFEKLVGLVYGKLGYVVIRRGGANPDGGVDLLLEKDGQRWAVQCKHWKSWDVGVRSVREFLGALTDSGIQKGIFITLTGYTGNAKELAEKHGIEIVNETGFARLLEITNALADPMVVQLLHDTQKFCPRCENVMVRRTAKKGRTPGNEFWGCSTYPRCGFTMPCEQ